MKLTNEDSEICFNIVEMADALDCGGVYAILNEDDDVMYVGESKCMFMRLCQHIAGMDKNGVPKSCIKQFAVLAFEENRDQRLGMEQHYFYKLKPKYGKLGDSIYRRMAFDKKVVNYKRRMLYKHGLASDLLPSMSVEEPNDALTEELRFLNTNVD